MAFQFNDNGAYAKSQSDFTVVTSDPLSMSVWFKYDESIVNPGPMASIQRYAGISIMNMMVNYGVANSVSAGSYGTAWEVASVTGLSTDTWYHGHAIFASNVHRRMVVDGDWAGSATNTVQSTPNNLDHVSIGAQYFSSQLRDAFAGTLGEIGIWNIEHTESDNAALAAGVSPLLVRPENLLFYWDGLDSGLVDVMGAPFASGGSGGTQVSDHPPIIKPSAQILQFPPVSAGGSYTLIADAGNFAITGFDANLEHHRSLTADAGSFDITGFDATLIYDQPGVYILPADAGSYAITGFSANLIYSGSGNWQTQNPDIGIWAEQSATAASWEKQNPT